MNNINYKRILPIFLFLTIAFPVWADEYTLDPNHSYVEWKIDHFGYSHPTGKWWAQGTLQLDKNKIDQSQVNVTINTAEIVTGIKKLDEHLKGKDFFDVQKYPNATFVSEKIESENNKPVKLHGTLTVHGVSKPVILDVSVNKMGVNPMTKKDTLGFTAKTKLKRSDFGINSYLPDLGDEVELAIEVEAIKK